MTGQPQAAPAANTSSAETRVVLVDPRPERRAVLRTVIEHSNVPAIVLGEADDGADAIRQVEQHAADLVVIDLQPPVEESLAVVAALRSRFPALVILVCSFHPTDPMRQRVLAEGADAYLLKPVSAHEVMAAMREAPLRISEIDAIVTAR